MPGDATVGFRPALQRQMPEDQASLAGISPSAAATTAPALPLLAVEFLQGLQCFLLLLALAAADQLQQRSGNRIAGSIQEGESSPASRARRVILPACGKALSRFFHLPPGRVGIDRADPVGDRAAAAQGRRADRESDRAQRPRWPGRTPRQPVPSRKPGRIWF